MSRLDAAVLQQEVQRLFEPTASVAGSGLGRVGVELELIPLNVRSTDGPIPADVSGPELLHQLGADSLGDEQVGRFSFEPGGQIEYSTPAVTSLAELVEDMGRSMDPLCTAARDQGMRLAAIGLAPWYGPEAVGLCNPTRRYLEMDRYFRRLGPWGTWMMRLTASMQVNLDLGESHTAEARWRVANALSPVLTAVFANSAADLPDGTPVASGRAWVWSQLDGSRTGIVGRMGGGTPPWAEYLTFALTARVMFDHEMKPVESVGGTEPAVRFNDWWIAGSERGPVLEDWHIHLSTLFPDVRPKRWLEIRAIDMPARRWWSVPPTLLAALLYDERALREVEELFDTGPDGATADLSAAACTAGLSNPRLRDLASVCFEKCESAVRRFPAGWFGGEAMGALSAFRERYVEPGMTQSDEARADGLVAALAPRLQQFSSLPTAASLPPRSS